MRKNADKILCVVLEILFLLLSLSVGILTYHSSQNKDINIVKKYEVNYNHFNIT